MRTCHRCTCKTAVLSVRKSTYDIRTRGGDIAPASVVGIACLRTILGNGTDCDDRSVIGRCTIFDSVITGSEDYHTTLHHGIRQLISGIVTACILDKVIHSGSV